MSKKKNKKKQPIVYMTSDQVMALWEAYEEALLKESKEAAKTAQRYLKNGDIDYLLEVLPKMNIEHFTEVLDGVLNDETVVSTKPAPPTEFPTNLTDSECATIKHWLDDGCDIYASGHKDVVAILSRISGLDDEKAKGKKKAKKR